MKCKLPLPIICFDVSNVKGVTLQNRVIVSKAEVANMHLFGDQIISKCGAVWKTVWVDIWSIFLAIIAITEFLEYDLSMQ